jgi:multiple sugar transport system substrate-binding protein
MRVSKPCRVRSSFTVWLLLGVFIFMLNSPSLAKTVVTMSGHEYTRQMFEQHAAEYMALHPDVQLEFLFVNTATVQGMNKLLTMTAGDMMPDIIHSFIGITAELFNAGVLDPMPAQLAAEAQSFFLPPILPSVMFTGRLYGIPTENQLYALGWNQRLFNEAGVVANIKTWQDLYDRARKLTRVGGDGQIIQSGFSILGQYARFAESFINMIWNNGGDYIDANGVLYLDQPPAIETLEFLTRMSAEGLFSFDNHLRNGKGAMTVTPTFWRAQIEQQQPHDLEFIRTSLMPVNKGTHTAIQYGWGLFVSSQSKNKEIAWDFVRWLTMERGKSGFTRMSDSLMSMPNNRLDLGRKEYLEDPFFEGFVAGLEVLRSEPVLPQQSQRQQTIYQTLRPVILGTTSISQGIADVMLKLENSLKESGVR